jgi:hypothetical protein
MHFPLKLVPRSVHCPALSRDVIYVHGKTALCISSCSAIFFQWPIEICSGHVIRNGFPSGDELWTFLSYDMDISCPKKETLGQKYPSPSGKVHIVNSSALGKPRHFQYDWESTCTSGPVYNIAWCEYRHNMPEYATTYIDTILRGELEPLCRKSAPPCPISWNTFWKTRQCARLLSTNLTAIKVNLVIFKSGITEMLDAGFEDLDPCQIEYLRGSPGVEF